ncbi:MAG: trypsin-like serine protease [Deltaproteobacteria bacterium]|nr:trypsin-like serine protease [Deltaproteobacteria bacterium]
MRIAHWASAFVLMGVFAGCSTRSGDEPRSDGRLGATSQAIQDGDPDGTLHPFAVGVCGGRTGNAAQPCQGYCSGAVILPNLILTARHCVSSSPRSIDCTANPPIRFGGLSHNANSYWITTHNEMKNNPSIGWHHVSEILVPGGTDADIFCGNDIALLVLDDEIPTSEAQPITPNVQYSMSDPKFQRAFAAIGYGGTNADNFATTGGVRRYRAGIPVLCIPGDSAIPCPKPTDGFPENEFVGGTGTCGGDSGSSAYENGNYKKNVFISFGVLSRGGEVGSLCKQSVYTRLDKWRDFIIEGAVQASANWTKYPKPVPDWTGPFVPPPPEDDGGTSDAGPKPPSKLAVGETCGGNDQCQTNLCADGVCAQPCAEGETPSTCPEGFVCKADACVAQAGGGTNNAGGGSTTTTTSGCSAAPERTSGGLGLGIAFGALIFGAARRRRGRTNG